MQKTLCSLHTLIGHRYGRKGSVTVVNFKDRTNAHSRAEMCFYEHHEQRRIYSPQGLAEEKMESRNKGTCHHMAFFNEISKDRLHFNLG